MKKFLAAFILSFAALPVLADPMSDFLTQEVAAGIPLTGGSPGTSGFGSPGFNLIGGPSITPAQMTQANTDASTFNWTPAAQPGTVNSLMETIRLDTGISVAGRLEIARMQSFLLDNYANNPSAASLAELKARWAQIKAADAAITAADATRAQIDFAAANFPSQ